MYFYFLMLTVLSKYFLCIQWPPEPGNNNHSTSTPMPKPYARQYEGAGEWERVGRIEQDSRRMIRALMANQDDNAHTFWGIKGHPEDSPNVPGIIAM